MKLWYSIAFAVLLMGCSLPVGRELVVNLPSLPAEVQSELSADAGLLARPEQATVPHLFAPDSLDLITAARRTLALIDYGINSGRLDSR